MWPVRKPDGTWTMMVDYQELNEVVPPIHATVPSVVDLMDQLANELGIYHFVDNLANVFFSIDIAPESQDQFAFTWRVNNGLLQCSLKGTCTAWLSIMGLW